MANEARYVDSKIVPPAGQNDNQPVAQDQNYFYLNGVHSKSQLYLERMEGKQLINYFTDEDGNANPILGIHGDLPGVVFIETVNALYMFEHITDPIPT